MDNGDIDRFLAQLSPAQETVVLLKEISAKLSALTDIATVMMSARDYDIPRLPDGNIEDVITNISPQKTPFMKQQTRKPK